MFPNMAYLHVYLYPKMPKFARVPGVLASEIIFSHMCSVVKRYSGCNETASENAKIAL